MAGDISGSRVPTGCEAFDVVYFLDHMEEYCRGFGSHSSRRAMGKGVVSTVL